MKVDVEKWLAGTPTAKRPTKETLNHPGIIELATGTDVFGDTPDAFLRAYRALGVDIVNIVPKDNAPPPLKMGQVVLRDGSRVQESYLGVFNSSSRIRFPYETVDQFWRADAAAIDYPDSLDLPGAQYTMPCSREAIERKMTRVGDVGVYYYQLYTTLFMWGVEALGWDVFMMAAALDPERFDRHFLEPVYHKTVDIVTMLSDLDCSMVFCHDDIAMTTGPTFRPDWYETYIYPRYRELWKIPHERGKKLFLTADGKLDWALTALRDSGCDGVMFESPATDLAAVVDVFGDAFFIGGIELGILTEGSAADVRRHVDQIHRTTRDCPGFAMSCSGGLVGNIPLGNLEAYFDARAEHGYNGRDWREVARA